MATQQPQQVEFQPRTFQQRPSDGQLIKIKIPRNVLVDGDIYLNASNAGGNPREKYAIVIANEPLESKMTVRCIGDIPIKGKTATDIQAEIEKTSKKGAAVPTLFNAGIRPSKAFNGAQHLGSFGGWKMETVGFIERHLQNLKYEDDAPV
jgi:hypothetical protein